MLCWVCLRFAVFCWESWQIPPDCKTSNSTPRVPPRKKFDVIYILEVFVLFISNFHFLFLSNLNIFRFCIIIPGLKQKEKNKSERLAVFWLWICRKERKERGVWECRVNSWVGWLVVSGRRDNFVALRALQVLCCFGILSFICWRREFLEDYCVSLSFQLAFWSG